MGERASRRPAHEIGRAVRLSTSRDARRREIARRRNVRRIAWLSPMPPAKSGIATYSRAVLDGLQRTGFRDRHEVETLWPVARAHEASVPWYDLGVYHLGNNVEFHRDIYRHCVQTPGLVVLHDVALDDFVRGMLAAGDPLGAQAWREAVPLRRRLTSRDALANEPLSVPWCAQAVRRSRGVIVHSEFGKRYLEEFGCRTPIFVVPHPLVESPEALARAEAHAPEFRSAIEGVITVGVFGDLSEAKCIDRLLETVGMVEAPIRLMIVGRRIEGYDVEGAIARSGRGAITTLAPDVDDDEFLARLLATDVVVDLRHPHRGEASGSLARALQAGRPTIVSGTGTYLDLPDDVVLRVDPGAPRPEQLAAALTQLAGDAHLRRALGARAREHMAANGGVEATARGYEEAIGATMALLKDPARRALARWSGALLDCGVSEESLTRGYGMSYVHALSALAEPEP